jgi:septal ring-binding cell division protein DamX
MRVAPSRAFGVGTMHNNIRLKPRRFELSLGPKQVVAFLIAALVVLGSVFALGLGVGRKIDVSAAQPLAAPTDPLAHLDDAAREGPPPELKAQQALTDSRSTDKAFPFPTVNSVNASGVPGPRGDGRTAPELEMAPPPARAASPSLAAPSSPTITATPPPMSETSHSRSAPRGAREAKPAPRGQTSEHSASPGSQQSSSKGTYTIQVASASSRAGAERLAKQLAGRDPRIVAADVPGMGRRYRVQIGVFDTREAAKLQALSLSRAGIHGVVTPSR